MMEIDWIQAHDMRRVEQRLSIELVLPARFSSEEREAAMTSHLLLWRPITERSDRDVRLNRT